MISVKKVLLVLSVMVWSVSSFAQLDSIHIGQIRSSVPIVGKLADLPFVFDGKGEWRYGTFNFELKYYSWTIDDTAIYVNRVNTIYDKKTKTYYDSGLLVRLTVKASIFCKTMICSKHSPMVQTTTIKAI